MSSPAVGKYEAAPADQPKPWPGRKTWSIAAVIMASVFFFQLQLTFRLNSHGDLEMINRYFDADNAWYLVNFETGDQKFGSYGGRNFVHPNVANFIHPLVLVGSGVIGLFDHNSASEVRKKVSLAVAPVFAGIRSGLLFAAVTVAGFGLVDALLATALGSVAFSSVLFGCLPESFVISGAVFALYFFLAARFAIDTKLRLACWVFAGMMLSSVTITNLVPFAIGLFYLLYILYADAARAVKKTALISAAALLATMVCFFVLTAMHGTFRGIGRRVGQLEEIRFNPQSLFIDFPKAIAHSLVPIRPNQLSGTDEEGKSKQIQIVRFTYRDDLERIKHYVETVTGYERLANNGALETATLSLIVLGVLLSSRVVTHGAFAAKTIFLLSLTQLLFHWILHSFFGLDLMLYSQHWVVPLVVAICSGLTLSGRYRWVARAVVLSLVVAATWQTAAVMKVLVAL